MEDAEKKALKLRSLLDDLAETGAKSFEDFLMKNQDTTMEDKHRALVSTLDAHAMMTLLAFKAI